MKFTKSFSIFMLILGCQNVLAQQEYSCVGSIDYISQHHAGAVHVTSQEMFGDSNARKLCELNADYNGVPAEVCKAWFSKLLAAKATSSDLSFQYRDSQSCSTQPSYSASLLVHSIRDAN